MVLDLFFYGFSCISMVCIMQNPKIPDIFWISGNIKQKRANFCRKWPPRLKMAETDISRFALFLEILRSSKVEIWPSYREKWLKKYVQIRFLKFHFFGSKITHLSQKTVKMSQNHYFLAQMSDFRPEKVKFQKSDLYIFF